MDATVVICTWNRADSLRRVLECLACQRAPGVTWEVVVVDNASQDMTQAVLQQFQSTVPLVTAYESQQGLSYARNRGVQTAQGALVIWTDDDVVVGDDWVKNYVEGARRFGQSTIFGGHIHPHFVDPVPTWIQVELARLGHAYAARDFGAEFVNLAADRIPYGANYAIRREVQRAHLYDPNFGRTGTGMLSGEETTVMRALLAEGHAGTWLPNVPVQHVISADRLTLRYHFRYRMGVGSMASRQNKCQPRRVMVREAVQTSARLPLAVLREPPAVWVPMMLSSAYSLGQLRVRAPAMLRRQLARVWSGGRAGREDPSQR